MNHKIKLLGLFADDTQTAQLIEGMNRNREWYPFCPLAVLDESAPAAADLIAQFTVFWHGTAEPGKTPPPVILAPEQQSGIFVTRTVRHPVTTRLAQEWQRYRTPPECAVFRPLLQLNNPADFAFAVGTRDGGTATNGNREKSAKSEITCRVFYLAVTALDVNTAGGASYCRWTVEQPVWFSARTKNADNPARAAAHR